MSAFDLKYFPPQAIRLGVEAVQTADFTAENGKMYPINPAGATLNIQLPAPSASIHIVVKDLSGDLLNKTVTIVRNGTESIDGQASNLVLSSDFESATLLSDGVDWYLI
jgi:hypothetical protein